MEVGEETLPIIRSTKDVVAQAVYMRDKAREHLMAIFLNARNEMVYKKPEELVKNVVKKEKEIEKILMSLQKKQ